LVKKTEGILGVNVFWFSRVGATSTFLVQFGCQLPKKISLSYTLSYVQQVDQHVLSSHMNTTYTYQWQWLTERHTF
jgi:hypothetical protein